MAKPSTLRMGAAQYLPMALFGVLTLIGVIFIWGGKLSGWSTEVVTLVPIGIMLFYMAVSLVMSGFRLHNEQAGDNLYYMGFLFTLSSLGVSLYRFTAGTNIDDIVRNFGIAVTSTICGIALRILFNQMRRDPLDIERSVRHELAEMTRRVRSELDSSSREFSSYRRSSSQMLVEGFEEIGRQAERTGEAIQKAIESLSKESIRPIREVAETLATMSQQNQALFDERAKKVNASADEAAERLAATAGRISECVEGLSSTIDEISQKLKSMQSPEDLLRVELRPALDVLNGIGDQQRTLAKEASARFEAQAATTAKALAPLGEIPERFGRALAPLDKLPEQIGKSFSPVDESVQHLGEVVRNLSSVVERLSKVADRMASAAVVQPSTSALRMQPDRQAAFEFPAPPLADANHSASGLTSSPRPQAHAPLPAAPRFEDHPTSPQTTSVTNDEKESSKRRWLPW